jgi:hypothetical protein
MSPMNMRRMGNWVVVGNGESSDPADHLADRGLDLVRFLTLVLDAIEAEDKP